MTEKQLERLITALEKIAESVEQGIRINLDEYTYDGMLYVRTEEG